MNSFIQPLSLATFNDNEAQPPYLNTPRSLEACRIHGVAPLELVAVSINEFRKDYPDNPDIAQRRFDRVDGARKRILGEVLKEWTHLNEIEWTKQPKPRPKSATKETIISVRPEAHCELLELQASRFRKIERDNLLAVKRLCSKEIKAAYLEVKNKQILSKQADDSEVIAEKAREMKLARDEYLHEQFEAANEKKRIEEIELKRLQALETKNALDKEAAALAKAAEEKKIREDREERKQRDKENTRLKKEGILKVIQSENEQRKQMSEFRLKDSEDRYKHYKEISEDQRATRRKNLELKISKAKETVESTAESKAMEVKKQLEEDDAKRTLALKEKEAQRLEAVRIENEKYEKKMEKIVNITQGDVVEKKASKILAEIEFKDKLSKEMLDKVKQAQERRKTHKAIRQESFELASMRQKKADEYKQQKTLIALKNKQDRVKAIEDGYTTLNVMRNNLKDVMAKTTSSLKDEIHRLYHRDEVSPDVMHSRLMGVTNDVLFPSLSIKFKFDNKPKDLFKKEDNNNGDSENNNLARSTSFITNEDGESPVLMNSDGRAATAPNQLSKSLNDLSTLRENLPNSRKVQPVGSGKGTLPLKLLQKDNLFDEIDGAKARIDINVVMEAEKENRRKLESKQGKRKSPSKCGSSPNKSPSKQFENTDVISVHSTGNQSNHSKHSKNSKTSRKDISKSHAVHGGDSVGDDSTDYLNKSLATESDIFPMYKYSHDNNLDLNSKKANFGSDGSKIKGDASYDGTIRTNELNESKPRDLREPLPGEFRREFSKDHPLAGGTGKYNKELSTGMKASGTGEMKDIGNEKKNQKQIEKLTFEAQIKVVDPQRHFEQLRKEQNDALLRVLDVERIQEENRESSMRQVSDLKERARLDLIFAEERRRASERIINLTKEHEKHIKDAVIKMMQLGEKEKRKQHK